MPSFPNMIRTPLFGGIFRCLWILSSVSSDSMAEGPDPRGSIEYPGMKVVADKAGVQAPASGRIRVKAGRSRIELAGIFNPKL